MADSEAPKVLNVHHFGGIDKLPSNVIYIGRPGPHGNTYSSVSGKYTKEECVALHRVDLYKKLKLKQILLTTLRKELGGYDLACWCKQPNRIKACHGDTYLHVLSDTHSLRTYEESITYYLMDDLRSILKSWDQRVWDNQTPSKDFLELYMHLGDVTTDIKYVLIFCREKYVDYHDLHFFLSSMVVDLELAYQDHDLKVIAYRFDHVLWLIGRFMANRQDKEWEPVYPYQSVKKPKRNKE